MDESRAAELRRTLIRHIAEIPLERQFRPPLYDTTCGSLSSGTAARKLGAGLDILAPGQRGCPYHYHLAQEELFVVLEGEGSLRVAGEMVPVRAGDVVFIPPGEAWPHQFINTSDAPMKFISISTKEYPELCVYPDSGKVMAWQGELTLTNRVAANLDYWDGEP